MKRKLEDFNSTESWIQDWEKEGLLDEIDLSLTSYLEEDDLPQCKPPIEGDQEQQLIDSFCGVLTPGERISGQQTKFSEKDNSMGHNPQEDPVDIPFAFPSNQETENSCTIDLNECSASKIISELQRYLAKFSSGEQGKRRRLNPDHEMNIPSICSENSTGMRSNGTQQSLSPSRCPSEKKQNMSASPSHLSYCKGKELCINTTTKSKKKRNYNQPNSTCSVAASNPPNCNSLQLSSGDERLPSPNSLLSFYQKYFLLRWKAAVSVNK